MKEQKQTLSPARRKNRARNEQKKLVITIILTAFFVSVGYNIIKSGFELARLQEEKETLTQQLQDETQRSDELEEQIEQSDDLGYIEYLAKKYLNMVYPDEQKVVVTPQE